MNEIFDIDKFIDDNYLINNMLSKEILNYLRLSLQNNNNTDYLYNYFNNISNTPYKKNNDNNKLIYSKKYNRPFVQYKKIVLDIYSKKVGFSYIDYDYIYYKDYSKNFLIDYMLLMYQFNYFLKLLDYNNNDNYVWNFIIYIESSIEIEDDKNNFIKCLIFYDKINLYDIPIFNNIEKIIFDGIKKYKKINNKKITKNNKNYFLIENIYLNILNNKEIDLELIFKEYFLICNSIKKLIHNNNINNNILNFINENYVFDTSLMKYINDENSFIQEMKKLKNINIIKECYKDFQNNKKLKYIVIFISIRDTNFYEKEINAHANSIILFKNNNVNNKYDYLCLRIEPYRHANFYCRNSVRSYLRDLIVENIPNCYYIDYITKNKIGL